MTTHPITFASFYRDHYLPDHRHPANVALHVAGTLCSAVAAATALLSPMPWLALLYPILHVGPGLIGHRLFERNAVIGDVRILRTDFPLHWFLAANHRLTASCIRGLFGR